MPKVPTTNPVFDRATFGSRVDKPSVRRMAKEAVEERAHYAHQRDGLDESYQLWRLDAVHHVARELRKMVDDLIGEYVADARAAEETWRDIARHLNVTKGAAINRYGPSGR